MLFFWLIGITNYFLGKKNKKQQDLKSNIVDEGY